MMTSLAIDYALRLLAAVPMLVQTGRDVGAAIQNGANKVQQFKDEGRDPTPTEWTELNDMVDGLRAELHAVEQRDAGAAAPSARLAGSSGAAAVDPAAKKR